MFWWIIIPKISCTVMLINRARMFGLEWREEKNVKIIWNCFGDNYANFLSLSLSHIPWQNDVTLGEVEVQRKVVSLPKVQEWSKMIVFFPFCEGLIVKQFRRSWVRIWLHSITLNSLNVQSNFFLSNLKILWKYPDRNLFYQFNGLSNFPNSKNPCDSNKNKMLLFTKVL
jgi:hypothetical protein